MSVLAIHRDPFSVSPHSYRLPEGTSLADMTKLVRTLPEGWPRHEWDVICINGHPVPQPLWGMVKPKPAANGVRTEVTFHAPPMGGGGDGGKNVLGVVASIGLVALTGGIAGGTILGGLSSNIATGLGIQAATAARLLSASVLLAGSAALSLLAPTPTLPQLNQDTSSPADAGNASAQGNVLEPNTPLTRVVGTRKVFPEFVTEPFVYYEGDDEVVELIAALAGPHSLTDIRIDGSPADDMPLVDYETKEGWPGEDRPTNIRRYARTAEPRSELRGHNISPGNETEIQAIDGSLEDGLPQAKVLTTRTGQDEFWIGIEFPRGISLNGSATDDIRVPFRLRIREKGDTTWINLPELHFMNSHLGSRRATIRFVWRDQDVNVATAANGVGWVEARIKSLGQDIAPTGSDYDADAAFDADTGGDDYVDASNSSSTDVRNIIGGTHQVQVNLNTATFPRGQYEIEIKRGYAFQDSDYVTSTYKLNASVRDFFAYESSGSINQTKSGLVDQAYVVRYSSVFNDHPVNKGNVALISMIARNTAINRLSVLASGYVQDWDGSAWTTWTTTSNPAPHLRDVLGGLLNASPVPADIIDDDSLTDWRTAAHDCNAIIRNLSVAEAARIICGTGFAKLYQSEVWGVMRDYDRSAESPVQYFSDHNSANFRWSKAFLDLPDGFRASFVDANRDYETRQIIHPEGAGKTEQVTIEGLVTEAKVTERLDYDLAVARKRTAFYSFEAPAEAINCRRGSLIGVQAGMLTAHAASGRIIAIEFNGSGSVTAIYLDGDPPILDEDTWSAISDLSAIEDMSLIGLRSGAVLRRAEGPVSAHQVSTSSTGNKVIFDTSFAPNGLANDDLVILGPYETEFRRQIVLDMVPRDDLTWTITALAEVPELFA